ncbi:hypothetical protein Hanom_Chr07g00674291 [Helianthus anomalus]
MVDEFLLYEDLRIGPKFFISNRSKIFFVIFGDGPDQFLPYPVLDFVDQTRTGSYPDLHRS